MTYERIAIQALGRCTLPPGTSAKRFAREMAATAEEFWMTAKQRAWMWALAHRYRRQMPPIAVKAATEWLAVPKDERAFHDAIEADLKDGTPRLVFADWLVEHGRNDEAQAQRWMAETRIGPTLMPCGQSHQNGGVIPINFEWSFGMKAWELFDQHHAHGPSLLGYWHHSREIAEKRLATAMWLQGFREGKKCLTSAPTPATSTCATSTGPRVVA